MNDERIRDSLKICLSDSRFPPEKQREVLERIQGEQTVMKRKTPYAIALAAALLLAMSALAVAAGLGVFGSMSGNVNSETNGARLERLDEAADSIGANAAVCVHTAQPQEGGTDYEQLLFRQGKRTFGLTIHQAYCDGRKLYYSYTLTTEKPDLTFHEGCPTGFGAWEWSEPGKRLADVWSFDPPETDHAMREWFAGEGPRYAVMDSAAVGDGADIADGSEKGVPTMILDSSAEWIDDTTLQGFQEVELPKEYALGEEIPLLLPVMYSTTVYYQDETGVHRQNIRHPENRGILRIPFAVTVGGNTQEMTGVLCTQDYSAHARLTFTDVTAYGEVYFNSCEWADAYQAETDHWMNGGEGEAPATSDMITSYQLIAGDEVLKNIGGGFGLNESGMYHVIMEFDLPKDTSRLCLKPENAAFAADVIELSPAP